MSTCERKLAFSIDLKAPERYEKSERVRAGVFFVTWEHLPTGGGKPTVFFRGAFLEDCLRFRNSLFL